MKEKEEKRGQEGGVVVSVHIYLSTKPTQTPFIIEDDSFGDETACEENVVTLRRNGLVSRRTSKPTSVLRLLKRRACTSVNTFFCISRLRYNRLLS